MAKSGAQIGNKNRQKYAPIYCDLVIAYLENFNGISTFGSSLPHGFQVSYMTVTRWRKKYPEFEFAVDIGTQKRNGKLFKLIVKGAEKSPRLMIWLMENYLGMKPKTRKELEFKSPLGTRQEVKDYFDRALAIR